MNSLNFQKDNQLLSDEMTSRSRTTSRLKTISQESSLYEPPLIKRGILLKSSKYFSVWNERFLILRQGMLLTFEAKKSKQIGEYNLSQFDMVTRNYSDIGSLKATQDNGDEDLIVLKKRKMSWTGVLLIKLKVMDSRTKLQDKQQWLNAIQAHIVYAKVIYCDDIDVAFSNNALNIKYSAEEIQTIHFKMLEELHENAPSMMTGWLIKRGQIAKSWRRRFFVLHKGILSYYTEESSTEPFGHKLKGQLKLWNFMVSGQMAADKIYLSTDVLEVEVNSKLRILIMTSRHDDINEEWITALSAHIEYAKRLVKTHRHLISNRYFYNNQNKITTTTVTNPTVTNYNGLAADLSKDKDYNNMSSSYNEEFKQLKPITTTQYNNNNNYMNNSITKENNSQNKYAKSLTDEIEYIKDKKHETETKFPFNETDKDEINYTNNNINNSNKVIASNSNVSTLNSPYEIIKTSENFDETGKKDNNNNNNNLMLDLNKINKKVNVDYIVVNEIESFDDIDINNKAVILAYEDIEGDDDAVSEYDNEGSEYCCDSEGDETDEMLN